MRTFFRPFNDYSNKDYQISSFSENIRRPDMLLKLRNSSFNKTLSNVGSQSYLNINTTNPTTLSSTSCYSPPLLYCDKSAAEKLNESYREMEKIQNNESITAFNLWSNSYTNSKEFSEAESIIKSIIGNDNKKHEESIVQNHSQTETPRDINYSDLSELNESNQADLTRNGSISKPSRANIAKNLTAFSLNSSSDSLVDPENSLSHLIYDSSRPVVDEDNLKNMHEQFIGEKRLGNVSLKGIFDFLLV